MLLYGFDASFVDLDSRYEPFNVGRVLLTILLISRTKVLPVLLARLSDFKAAIQDLFTFDKFSTKPLEPLTVCECDQVVMFAVAINVNK